MVLPMAGCKGALSTIDPAGPAAREIATLWWVLLIGATLIFILVTMCMALGFRKPKTRRETDTQDVKVWIFGLGLGFPLTVLAALLAYGLVIGEALLPHQEPDLVRVSAEARQWEWRFGYGDASGRVTTDVLHLPAGRPVDVAITSTDVIHSFWVPRLAGKLDAVPGHINTLRIEAYEPGRYQGLSSEYSGRGYSEHRFVVIAHGPEAWERFLAGETP